MSGDLGWLFQQFIKFIIEADDLFPTKKFSLTGNQRCNNGVESNRRIFYEVSTVVVRNN